MKYFFLILFTGWTVLGADTPIAVVKGTNVVFVTVADLTKFTNKVGESNVVISAKEVGVIAKGWRYVGGQFLNPNGSAISNGTKAVIDRSKLIDAAISDMVILQDKTVKATWDAMAVSNKLEVVRIGLNRLGIVMEKLLVEKRNELFELKGDE